MHYMLFCRFCFFAATMVFTITLCSNVCFAGRELTKTELWHGSSGTKLFKFYDCNDGGKPQHSGMIIMPCGTKKIRDIKKRLHDIFDKAIKCEVIKQEQNLYVLMLSGESRESDYSKYLLFNGAFALMCFYNKSDDDTYLDDTYLQAQRIRARILQNNHDDPWFENHGITPVTHDMAVLELNQVSKESFKKIEGRLRANLPTKESTDPDPQLEFTYQDNVRVTWHNNNCQITVYNKADKGNQHNFKALIAGLFSYAMDRDCNDVHKGKSNSWTLSLCSFNMTENIDFIASCLRGKDSCNQIENCEESSYATISNHYVYHIAGLRLPPKQGWERNGRKRLKRTEAQPMP